MITVPLINWQPMGAMPEDRKDGRLILLWELGRCNVASWNGKVWDSGYASEIDGDPLLIESPTYWADINPPE